MVWAESGGRCRTKRRGNKREAKPGKGSASSERGEAREAMWVFAPRSALSRGAGGPRRSCPPPLRAERDQSTTQAARNVRVVYGSHYSVIAKTARAQAALTGFRGRAQTCAAVGTALSRKLCAAACSEFCTWPFTSSIAFQPRRGQTNLGGLREVCRECPCGRRGHA